MDVGNLTDAYCGGEIVTGADAGGAPVVRVFCCSNGGPFLSSFYAFASTYTGGVRVAVGNHDTDTLNEIVTGSGTGSPGSPGSNEHLRVYNTNGTLVRKFWPYETSWAGGIYVASGQVNSASSNHELVVGKGPGDFPKVRVYTWREGRSCRQ